MKRYIRSATAAELQSIQASLSRTTNEDASYHEYLTAHIANVKGVWEDRIKPTVTDIELLILTEPLIAAHDESKWEDDEWYPYLWRFYPDGNMSQEDIDSAFQFAWLRHRNGNKHHWDYWVLLGEDNPMKLEPLDIPECYVIEMICDWGSFRYGAADGGLDGDNEGSTRDWYNENKHTMVLTEATEDLIDKYLDLID